MSQIDPNQGTEGSELATGVQDADQQIAAQDPGAGGAAGRREADAGGAQSHGCNAWRLSGLHGLGGTGLLWHRARVRCAGLGEAARMADVDGIEGGLRVHGAVYGVSATPVRGWAHFVGQRQRLEDQPEGA